MSSHLQFHQLEGCWLCLGIEKRKYVSLFYRSSLTCYPAEDLHASQVATTTTKHAHRRAKLRSSKACYFGKWNVRSLIDNEGTVETARMSSEVSESEDRRIDLVIRELNQYNIKVATLQETKWFGNAVYHIGSYQQAAVEPSLEIRQRWGDPETATFS